MQSSISASKIFKNSSIIMVNDYPPVSDVTGYLLGKWMEIDIINFERI